MHRKVKYICILTLGLWAGQVTGWLASPVNAQDRRQDTTRVSPPDLPYPIPVRSHTLPEKKVESPLFLKNPSNFETRVDYDTETNRYIIYETVGGLEVGLPRVMTPDEYRQYRYDQIMREYWRLHASGDESTGASPLIPKIYIESEAFDKIFGTSTIDIKPQGTAELIFGINSSRIDNPQLSEKLRRVATFDFQEKIQMNVTGSIGDKMMLGVNYNTEATFDFENKTKLEYSGNEDEIIKKIEAGDVTLPLSGSLITGSQSLFGLKTELQFGRLTVTSVFSQQKGETSVIEVKGGAQQNEFEVFADEYDANRHFFLSHYFRERYNEALANLPVINSPVQITRVEVWVTNKTSDFENSRNIVAFMDLGENERIHNAYFTPNPAYPFPDNRSNSLYDEITGPYNVRDISTVSQVLDGFPASDFSIGQDFEKIENARKLAPNEYTFHPALGYISLNAALHSDEVLAVAYEFRANGKVYQVGEFSFDGINAPDALILKLLKGTNLTPKLPTWDLMMKNIYAIGAYQVNPQNFEMNIIYMDDQAGTGINYLREGDIKDQILLRVMNLDNLNGQMDPYPDGMFDFIEGVTILPSNGRVIFPVLEPFGSYLREKIGNDVVADKYVFEELYDSTLARAIQVAEKNKFRLQGTYQSSVSSEIPLNALNVPQGSVVVTAGGIQLKENIDYTVDYTLGRVNILNTGLLESGTPIRISLESNQLFNIQTKTLVGSHFDYRISDNFNVGATILNLTERPLTQKVNIGNEPISNTIWGINSSFHTEAPFVTRMVDLLPFVNTNQPSSITFFGEFAHLIPGHSRAIEKQGITYIDDFEGSETSIDLKSIPPWVHASTPQGQPDLFPEGTLTNNLAYGFNRARLAWYVIDPLFLRNNSSTPAHIKNNPDLQSSHYVREVFEKEIWPNKESPSGIPTNIAVLNLSFYPREKGPYNYDTGPSIYSAGLDPSGYLAAPETRWGGIMREVPIKDFETSNIQFIEFWLMDPFVEDSLNPGGELYINLGNVSEDILRDGRKSFENGLPTSPEEEALMDTTVWGRVPKTQSLVKAFDQTARKQQDIGLDGLSNEQEQEFYNDYVQQLSSQVSDPAMREELINDPGQDDFHYFRGSDYDAMGLGILERYKKYNGLEGNSPAFEETTEDYPTSGSTLPNEEDINRDNTLSETESYYQYKVDIRKDFFEVGRNYIINRENATVEFANGKQSSVDWYQFRIPVTDFERIVGNIQDFKSIRFVRLFLKGFEKETHLRFARFELIRGEWRKYNLSIWEGGERETTEELTDASFEIGSVNIEENGGKDPVNYVLPPGITRVIDPTNPELRQLNEQSIVLKVRNLADGDARAAFRNVNLDIRQYKRLEMEVHAEALPGINLQDDEIHVFIRLGSDYRNNFYEYEIPVKLTPPKPPQGYSNESVDDRRIVWPEENRFDIPLELFQDVKQTRNNEMQNPANRISVNDLFSMIIDGHRVSVTGNPNLSNIRTIMIGIRNPSQQRNPGSDDGLPKSAEVWMNELRLTHFNEEGGWAANARVTTRLADLGSIDIAGSTSTPGFGSIEKKVNERSKETVMQYDISSNLELGKFLPDALNFRIPMYIGFSEGIINPQYNPLDPDIPLRKALNNAETRAERDSILKNSQDITRRKSINFTNVRIEKRQGKPHFWDISNFALSYSYHETYHRDIKTDFHIQKNYRGTINYIYNAQPKPVVPFQQSQLFRRPIFRLIRDFNFNYMPSHISLRTDMYRYYEEKKLRKIDNPDLKIEPTFRKDFEWNTYFDLKYDLTRALKIDFSSSNTARIDEPEGGVDRERYEDSYTLWKDSVLTNLKNMGRTISYHHSLNVNYTLPINKIPLFNWVTVNARYNATFGWDAGPQFADTSDIELGNTIKNSNTGQLSGQLNMNNLYNKVGFLKKVNDKYRNNRRADTRKKEYKTVTYERKGVYISDNRPRSVVHNLKTEDVQVTIYDENNRKIDLDVEIMDERRIRISSDTIYRGTRVVVEGQVEKGEDMLTLIADNLARILMSVKNVSISYSQTQGTLLPGYLPETRFYTAGLTDVNGMLSPGWEFILGIQDRDFLKRSIGNDWLTTDHRMTSPYVMTHNENFNLRSTLEPIPGMRIDVTATRRFSKNMNEYYSYNDSLGRIVVSNPVTTGNFSISMITWGTAFKKISSDNRYASEIFNRMKDYASHISARLAAERVASPEHGYNPNAYEIIEGRKFYDGYGPTSQQVLIPAFLAAYTNRDPDRITIDPFPSLLHIMPNWRLTYEGLSNIEFLKSFIRSITINHQYRSSYDVAGYSSNLEYEPDEDGFSYVRDMTGGNFLPPNEISAVSINEQFSPLINFEMNWVNSLTSRIEYRKSRSLALSFANNQLTDVMNNELIIGAGYRFDEVQFIIRTGGGEKHFKSDLNVRLDLSVRDSKTVLRKLVEEQDQITAGQQRIALQLSADYVLSDRFNLRLFFDKDISNPYVYRTFPTSNTNFGFSVRFTLAQ